MSKLNLFDVDAVVVVVERYVKPEVYDSKVGKKLGRDTHRARIL
jgi:hypothetical protein